MFNFKTVSHEMTHDDVNPPDKVTLQRDRLSIYPTSAFPVNCVMRFLSRGNYLQSRAVYFQPSSWQYIIINRLSRWALQRRHRRCGHRSHSTDRNIYIRPHRMHVVDSQNKKMKLLRFRHNRKPCKKTAALIHMPFGPWVQRGLVELKKSCLRWGPGSSPQGN